MRPAIWTVSIGLVVASAELRAQATGIAAVPPTTAVDIAAAMQAPEQFRVRYASDGSARGDSTAQMAGYGVAELEGGARQVGLRLVAAAQRRGMSDLSFFCQAGIYSGVAAHWELALSLFTEAAERWPTAPCAWRGRAYALRHLGRGAEADSAAQRAAQLPVAP